MTKIEWTDETWNPVTGCTPASTGCLNCYAKRMAKRLAGRFGYPEAPHEFDVTLHEDRLIQPIQWKKPRMVFVCSMSDLFHEDVPSKFIKRDVWSVMVDAKQHIFQLLTKRPERALELLGNHTPWPSNVWLGVSCENQEQADKRIPLLLATPAAVRFVSLEPLLGAIDVEEWLEPNYASIIAEAEWEPVSPDDPRYNELDWVIVGGESGPGARPMHPQWARDIRDQCREALTPYFFKQWGAWAVKDTYARFCSSTGNKLPASRCFGVLDPDGTWHAYSTGWNARPEDPDTGEAYMVRVGKKRAGRLLDGREWNLMPEVAR